MVCPWVTPTAIQVGPLRGQSWLYEPRAIARIDRRIPNTTAGQKIASAQAPRVLSTGDAQYEMTASLQELPKQTSRSFYLTLRVLPRAVRPQIDLAYLLARTTDQNHSPARS